MAHLAINLFGQFQTTLNGDLITTFESKKVRAFLAFLVLDADHPHPRDALTGLFWPEEDDRTARRNLSQALFNLRQVLHDDEQAGFITVTREEVQFNTQSDYHLDVAAFEKLTSVSQEHAHVALGTCHTCRETLEQAEKLYRGELLAGFFVSDSAPFSEWLTLRREHYHLLAQQVLRSLVQLHEDLRHYERACYFARRLVELEPWQEEAHQQLMRLLARSGQRSAALRQFEICRQKLQEELGITPNEETHTLYERIRSAGFLHAHNLPEPMSPFIGRQALLSKIVQKLENPACRLLTLVGLGGIGKTRLALQAAREALPLFIHGAWYVPLAEADSVDRSVYLMAGSLGMVFTGSRQPWEQLLGFLHAKELLLVTDSLEHLQEIGGLLADIIQQAPNVKILATSREPVGLRAEWLIDVPGMNYPGESESLTSASGSDAVLFFQQTAMRAKADFSLRDENLAAVVRICQLLEGIPLGLELASPWVRTLTCEQIASEIQKDLDFLTTKLRDMPDRHRSLRTVFSHSWKLLSEKERCGAARLSVFRGPFSAAAAQQVTGTAPAVLQALLDKSFLTQDQPGYLTFHALLKQFTAEKLAAYPAEEAQVRQAHASYYASFISQREEALHSTRQMEAQAELRSELDNLLLAWGWAVSRQDLTCIAQALDGLYLFFLRLGRFKEGQVTFAQAANIPGKDADSCLLQAKIRARQADFHAWLGNYAEARRLFQSGLEIAREFHAEVEEAFSLEGLGRVAFWAGEYEPAQQLLQASATLFRKISHPWGTAQALNYWANTICSLATDYGPSLPLYQESLALSQQAGDQAGVARALINLGVIYQYQKDYPSARSMYQQAMEISQKLGDHRQMAISMGNMGDVAYHCGELEQALDLLHDSLSIKQEIGSRYSIMLTMNYLGKVYRQMRQLPEARRWYIKALRIAQELNSEVNTAVMLASIAGLWISMGQEVKAAELLLVAQEYSGGDQDVITAVNTYLPQLSGRIDAHTLEVCRARAHQHPLAEWVSDLLAEKW